LLTSLISINDPWRLTTYTNCTPRKRASD